MSMLSLGFKLLRFGARQTVHTLDKLPNETAEEFFLRVYPQLIKELASDRHLSTSYVQALLANAKDRETLEAIREYLVSNRNDIPFNESNELLKQTLIKAGDIKWSEHLAAVKAKWLENHHDYLCMAIDHFKEMI